MRGTPTSCAVFFAAATIVMDRLDAAACGQGSQKDFWLYVLGTKQWRDCQAPLPRGSLLHAMYMQAPDLCQMPSAMLGTLLTYTPNASSLYSGRCCSLSTEAEQRRELSMVMSDWLCGRVLQLPSVDLTDKMHGQSAGGHSARQNARTRCICSS